MGENQLGYSARKLTIQMMPDPAQGIGFEFGFALVFLAGANDLTSQWDTLPGDLTHLANDAKPNAAPGASPQAMEYLARPSFEFEPPKGGPIYSHRPIPFLFIAPPFSFHQDIAAPLSKAFIDSPDPMTKGAPNTSAFLRCEAISFQGRENSATALEKSAV